MTVKSIAEVYRPQGGFLGPQVRVLSRWRVGQPIEQIEYNLLFRWFVGLGMDDAAWAPTTFTKNRDANQDPPAADGGNPTVDFHGQRRTNATHQSTTDPCSSVLPKGRADCRLPHSLRMSITAMC